MKRFVENNSVWRLIIAGRQDFLLYADESVHKLYRDIGTRVCTYTMCCPVGDMASQHFA